MNNIEDFLKQGKADVLRSMIDEARGRCEQVYETKRKLKQALREETKKHRGEGSKKKSNSQLTECKQKDKEFNCSQEIARVSQQLVMEMVQRIEDEGMFKEGVYSENLKFGGCGSADNIVSWRLDNSSLNQTDSHQPSSHLGSNIIMLYWIGTGRFPSRS